jgi:hypothetical protein
MMAAKFGQTKGLSLNFGKQTGYGLNAKSPAVAQGLFLISILSIADGVELIRQLDFLLFDVVRWFLGLTCDLWAENAKSYCSAEADLRLQRRMTTKKRRQKQKPRQ